MTGSSTNRLVCERFKSKIYDTEDGPDDKGVYRNTEQEKEKI